MAQLFRAQSTNEDAPVDAKVENAEIGKRVPFPVTAKLDKIKLPANLKSGVVTWVSDQNRFENGNVVYRLDDQPVVIVKSDIPFYRDLESGVQGSDVQQFSRLLVSNGFLSEPGSKVDSRMIAAIKKWQKQLGASVTGTVGRGTLIATRTLPALVEIDSAVTVGSQLNGGEQTLYSFSDQPTLSLSTLPAQEKILTEAKELKVNVDNQQVPVVISDKKSTEDGASTVFTFTAANGEPFCHPNCAKVMSKPEMLWSLEAIVIPQTTGPAVPVGALMVDEKGKTLVQKVAGKELVTQEVKILAASEGLAIVSGLNPGDVVRLNPRPASGGTPETKP
ncbi:peptidoglycan-binding domain-containing protein [Boudabousia tangfeifanii]|uniref:peptidoglycan-binding domain-containing protein n=1 Tax=Boudabousia tangfeifanii TaxID=1912795 RepID=UPI0014791911|nr:peptidoglycan-binding domain-containing protein [Boudabousia tangfeifanii]